jgi:hypothetical protein
MKFDKPKGGNPVDGPVDGRHPDGTTEAQRANCRAIYEDPEAYAEWRIRMGLSKPPEIRPSSIMRKRVAHLANRLSAELQAGIKARPRDRWEREPARKMTIEELSALYAADPITVSPELARANSVHALAQSQLGDDDGR